MRYFEIRYLRRTSNTIPLFDSVRTIETDVGSIIGSTTGINNPDDYLSGLIPSESDGTSSNLKARVFIPIPTDGKWFAQISGLTTGLFQGFIQPSRYKAIFANFFDDEIEVEDQPSIQGASVNKIQYVWYNDGFKVIVYDNAKPSSFKELVVIGPCSTKIGSVTNDVVNIPTSQDRPVNFVFFNRTDTPALNTVYMNVTYTVSAIGSVANVTSTKPIDQVISFASLDNVTLSFVGLRGVSTVDDTLKSSGSSGSSSSIIGTVDVNYITR